MKPGPKPLSGRTMTHAERQARYRAKQAAEEADFSVGVTADALREICDLDPFELENGVPPRGFGRDRSLADVTRNESLDGSTSATSYST